MPRPEKKRYICPLSGERLFSTDGDAPALEIRADELEALRLCDLKILLHRIKTEPIKKRKNRTLQSSVISFFSENKIPFDRAKIGIIMEPIIQKKNFFTVTP